MEKELDRNGYVSEEEGNTGTVKIADDVEIGRAHV